MLSTANVIWMYAIIKLGRTQALINYGAPQNKFSFSIKQVESVYACATVVL